LAFYNDTINVWVHHGEEIHSTLIHDDDMEHKEDIQDDMNGLLYETFRNIVEAK